MALKILHYVGNQKIFYFNGIILKRTYTIGLIY